MPTPDQNSKNPELMVTIWEKTIDLQIHLNEMGLTLRRTAVTAVGVTLGAGALAFRYGGDVSIFGWIVPVAFLFVLVGLGLTGAFFLMDRFWYHELLRASVSYAMDLEQAAKKVNLPCDLDLSRKIRKTNHAALRMSGGAKINVFYGVIALVLVVAALLLLTRVVQPVQPSSRASTASESAAVQGAPAATITPVSSDTSPFQFLRT